MHYQARHPPWPLSAAVESIWIYAGYRPSHFLERVLPSGTVELIVQLKDTPFRTYDRTSFALKEVTRGPLLVGARSEFQIIDTEQQLHVMGVHFRPGGIRSVFALPADELSGRDVPVDLVWKDFGDRLAERLAGATTPLLKLRAMEEILMERIDSTRLPHRVVPVALQRIEMAEEHLRIGALANELGLSVRRFIQVFTADIGLSPKLYARIRRFQRALRTIHTGKPRGWADLAFECGWCDQAHMIRDFKAFSGLTPTEYESLNGNFMLHVPVAERGQICPIPDGRPVASSPR